jgi:hypothetical protein
MGQDQNEKSLAPVDTMMDVLCVVVVVGLLSNHHRMTAEEDAVS